MNQSLTARQRLEFPPELPAYELQSFFFLPMTPPIPQLLKACKTISQLRQVHAHVIQKGLEQDHFIISHFICLSNSLSNLPYSISLFNCVSSPSTYLYNNLIKGYSENSSFCETLLIFIRMKRNKISPDRYTYPSLIKSSSNQLKEGGMLHGSAVRCGVDGDAYVKTSLIHLYSKCKEAALARKLFDDMCEKNVVSWTAIVGGYVLVGDLIEARRLFDQMPKRNDVSWNVMISGYAKCGDLVSARRLFDEMPNKNVVSYTSMIDGYAKAGDMASARFLFEGCLSNVDNVAWSALISGYVQNGQPDEAVKIFNKMSVRNIKPDEFVLVSLMSACSHIGSLELAERVDMIVRQSSVDLRQSHVAAALIDMNAKCGNMDRAAKLFEEMPQHDLISYCSMIQGLSIHGHGAQAVSLFSRMLSEGLFPDEVAFTVILTACSHAGLVEEAHRFFDCMRQNYSIEPSPDHYACMIDLLARTGQLQPAYELLKAMPVLHAGAMGAILGACKLHCNVELGEIVANPLFKIEPQNAGSHVLLSNIYAEVDRWSDVSKMRCEMDKNGIKKIIGRSWI